MTLDYELILSSYKEDNYNLTTTFFLEDGSEFGFVKNTNPLSKIKSILPVKIQVTNENGNTRITGVLPI